MKKNKVLIIVLICLAIILIGTIFVIKFRLNKVSNYIVFETADYESIVNIVFYDKNLTLDDTLKYNLAVIASQLKVNYPGKSIFYIRNNTYYDDIELYRCMQIVNGQKINKTDMNIFVKNDKIVEIQFLYNTTWQNDSNIDNIKITQDEAKK